MLANKRLRRRRGMPAGLKRYWTAHRRTGVYRVRRNSPNPRRHRRYASARHVVRYRRNPRRGLGTFLPGTGQLRTYGMTALGMVAPSVVTDRLLPMVGISLTGWLRRGVQLLVPGAVHFFAPRLLGRDTGAFIAGGYAVTILGVVNDLTGGTPGMVGAYERGRTLRAYERGPVAVAPGRSQAASIF